MNILIIEDSKSVSHIISTVLNANGLETECVTSLNVSPLLLKQNIFDIIISNVFLEKGGLKVLEEIRKYCPNVFVLGISTKSTWKEKVEFLNNGADDVLDYPFPMQELLARIQSLFRRPRENNRGILRIKDIEIDTESKQATLKNKDLPLRRREFQLLEYMVRNKNRAITRSELLDHVWDYRRNSGSNTVDVHVKRLRDKVNDKNLIETVHGFGYTIRDK